MARHNTSTNGNATPVFNAEQQVKRYEDATRRIEMACNHVLTSREAIFKQLLDPRRSIEDECGYPGGYGFVDIEKYNQLIRRDGLAKRVNELYPKECWQTSPRIYELEESDEPTEFEQAVDNLGRQMRGEHSWYRDREGSPIWQRLLELDILSGIGRYGCLLIGIDDKLPLSEPANGVKTNDVPGPIGTDAQYFDYINPPPIPETSYASLDPIIPDSRDPSTTVEVAGSPPPTLESKTKGKGRKLLFLRPLPEHMVRINQLEANIFNPRFGQPISYNIQLVDTANAAFGSAVGASTTFLNVHWTRVLHVADTWHSPSTSDILAYPRLECVLNNILALQKVLHGDAEGFWRGAFPGLSIETHPQVGVDIEVDTQAIRDAMEQYQNTLQRYIQLTGMTAKSLSPQVVDPSAHVAIHYEAISIATGIPMRLLKGSERGELASSQDEGQWEDKKVERNDHYTTPRIVVPFFDRLIYLGILPVPKAKQEKATTTSTSDKSSNNPFSSSSSQQGEDTEGGITSPNRQKEETEDVPNSPTANRRLVGRRKITRKLRGWNRRTRKVVTFTVNATVTDTETGYSIEWPHTSNLSEMEKADIFLKNTQALGQFVNANGETMMAPLDFWTKFAGYDEEEAQALVDSAEENVEEKGLDENPMMTGMGGEGFDNPFDDNGNFTDDEDPQFPVEGEEDEEGATFNSSDLYFFVVNYEETEHPRGEGGKWTSALSRAVDLARGAVIAKARHHVSTVHPSTATSEAVTAIIQSLSGESRGVAMAAATVVIGVTPYALVSARKGLNWLVGKLDEEKENTAKRGSAYDPSKKNREQRKRDQHLRRKQK